MDAVSVIVFLLFAYGMWVAQRERWFPGPRMPYRYVDRPVQRRRIPEPIRQAVFARDGWRCRWCSSTARLEVDHMVPWSRGGPDNMSNYQSLCHWCNAAKGARLLRRPDVAPWVSGERL